jgi:DNA sulfur modification protein DndD
MILFKRATFQNFRILRGVELDFSTDHDQPLTVIRGENASGKTTVLWAMQWAFWGDAILPDGGRDFRLHPVDWNRSDGPCPISVQITFETEVDQEGSTGIPRRYSVNRQCVEEVQADGGFNRHSHTLMLYELTDTGTVLKQHPELFISAIFPKELREVFFTDAARVLSFTGAELSATTKRKRVQDAIRALLGIDLLEDARGHVTWVQSEINSLLKESSADTFLKEIAGKIERSERELNEQTATRDSATEQLAELETMHAETSAQLEAALIKGDYEKLAKELTQADADAKRYRTQLDDCIRMRSDLYKDDNLPAGLLHGQIRAALDKLWALKEANQIPRNFLPVLQQRLQMGECICGEKLVAGDSHYEHVNKLMTEQQLSDETSSRLSYLVSAAVKFASADNTGHEWLRQLNKVWQMQANAEAGWREAEAKKRQLDTELKDLPKTDINQLRAHRNELVHQKERALERRSASDTSITRLNRELNEQRENQKNWMKRESRYHEQQAQLEAAQDLLNVLAHAFQTIQDTKIADVSEKMNDFFLRMIGAGREEDIVQRAEIGPGYDIVVYGPHNKLLDPDRDLSGAQRRSLTLAFILAVTTVSGVTAPVVIDTPISELSGAVRTECLRIMSQMSQQLILFLTRADIEGVQDVIDQYAGKVLTITNSTHYPQYLVNDLHQDKARTVVCKCSHREYCQICERHGDGANPDLRRRLDTLGATA